MNKTFSLAALTTPLILGACSINAPGPDQAVMVQEPIPVLAVNNVQRETILLVSLDDGTVIKQTISLDADLCFKQNSSSSTTCLTQGEPIFDPETNTILGYEMIEEHIDLIASSN